MHPCVTQTDPAFARSAAAGCWTPAQRSAVLASFLAWVFDAFDFFLMVFMMHAVATEFGTPVASVTWAIVPTLAMRPVVAFVFGRAAGWTGLICSYRHWRTTEIKQIFGVPKEKPGQRRGPADGSSNPFCKSLSAIGKRGWTLQAPVKISPARKASCIDQRFIADDLLEHVPLARRSAKLSSGASISTRCGCVTSSRP
jgi:hypothetical protein